MLYKQIRLRDQFKIMALRDHLTRSPNRRASLDINGLPKEQKVTFSVGVQMFEQNADKNVASMISKADDKLYLAKKAGKDQVIF